MLHARESYNRIQDPEGKIAEDEPVFLLRAKDILAPRTLLHWADRLEVEGGQIEMIQLARDHARLMLEWQEKNGAKVPDL